MKTMKKLITTTILCALLLTSFSACKVADDGIEEDTYISLLTTEESETSAPKTEEVLYVEQQLQQYKKALELLDAGNIQEAYDIFLEIKDFRDVADYLERFYFRFDAMITRYPNSANVFYFEYDEYGKQTLELSFSSSSTGMFSASYQYDDNENLTMVKNIYKSGKSEEVTVYEYDEKGRAIKQINPYGEIIEIEYDENGNIIKRTNTSGRTVDYTYDADGNLLTEESKKDGVRTLFKTCKYDLKGNFIEQILEYDSGKTVTTIEYDENDRMIRRYIKQSNGIHYGYEYEYDASGNKTKQKYLRGSSVLSVDTWKYDENGSLLEYHIKDENELTYSTYYENDDNGNCTKKTYIAHKINYSSITTYEYDKYGNVLKMIVIEGADPLEDVRITTYSGYKLYYNPYPLQEIPSQLDGKG